MSRSFLLEYWLDDGWYVGHLKEVPGVFSQGETLEVLEDNIQDAYELLAANEGFMAVPTGAISKPCKIASRTLRSVDMRSRQAGGLA